MTFKALTAGLLLGFFAALAPSCATNKCGPTNCDGCCQGDNKCVPGTTNAACGTQGAACFVCEGTQSCQEGTCGVGPGGNGDEFGTGLCNPTSCANGCCTAADKCVLGTLSSACGTGGRICKACDAASGQSCSQAQVCASAGAGAGVMGKACTHDSECSAVAGAVCRKVSAVTGAVSYPQGYCTLDCGAPNAECPSDSLCVDYSDDPSDEGTALCSPLCSPAASACRSGYLCYPVQGDGVPDNVGICWPDAFGTGACNPNTCPNGCCNAQGACVSGTADGACGTSGRLCRGCDTGAGQVCTSRQVCGAAGAGREVVGKSCTDDGQCSGLAGAVCRKTTAVSGAGTYPQGYCTVDCGAPGVGCPSDSLCIDYSDRPSDEGTSLCSSSCTPDGGASSCGDGYRCYRVSGLSNGICWLDKSKFDWGPPADKLGRPCTTDTQCQGPKDGLCVPETDGGFVGGYCVTFTCGTDVSVDHCGDAGTCLAVGTQAACFASCGFDGGQGNCRDGYICRSYVQPDGGSSSAAGVGTCQPRRDGGA